MSARVARASAGRLALARTAFALLTCALLAGGCDRRPRLVPAGADSLVTLSRDSLVILARSVQDRWESGDQPDEAARLSAVLVLSDLSRRNPAEWGSRTREFLDSLSIGAELATAPCIEAINFFSRSNPEGGSWPYLVWCGETHPRMQALEGRGHHLLAVGVATFNPSPENTIPPAAPPAPSTSVALLYTHRSAGGQQPLVTVWSHVRKDDPWNLVQTLGADSLGGVGSAELAERDTALQLVSRTYHVTRGFDECPTCPHVYRTKRFRLAAGGFSGVEQSIVPSPYATFVQFIAALNADDRDALAKLAASGDLVDQAKQLGWAKSGGTWRVAPETDEAATSMVIFRGRDEAYKVSFIAHDEDWLISAIAPTTNAIE